MSRPARLINAALPPAIGDLDAAHRFERLLAVDHDAIACLKTFEYLHIAFEIGGTGFHMPKEDFARTAFERPHAEFSRNPHETGVGDRGFCRQRWQNNCDFCEFTDRRQWHG
jgi:hypothetical protein